MAFRIIGGARSWPLGLGKTPAFPCHPLAIAASWLDDFTSVLPGAGAEEACVGSAVAADRANNWAEGRGDVVGGIFLPSTCRAMRSSFKAASSAEFVASVRGGLATELRRVLAPADQLGRCLSESGVGGGA